MKKKKKKLDREIWSVKIVNEKKKVARSLSLSLSLSIYIYIHIYKSLKLVNDKQNKVTRIIDS